MSEAEHKELEQLQYEQDMEMLLGRSRLSDGEQAERALRIAVLQELMGDDSEDA